MQFGPNRHTRNEQLQSLKQANHLMEGVLAARRLLLIVLNVSLFGVGTVALFVTICVLWELRRIPDLSYLENYQPVGYIQIFDKDDKLICKIEGSERRKIIPLKQVTPHLQRAVLAAEDHHFYEHHGIDPVGIARACLVNIAARHTVQGGSTITQQLAKNLFFEEEKRGMTVKIAEAIAANQLENRFSKEKILELYLNEVYFGNGAYGIEQAANLYFDKSAAQLTIAESAYIAGLIRSPSRGGNPAYISANMSRQRDVINKMLEYGFITQDQWIQARKQWLFFKARPQKKIVCSIPKYPYYVSYVLDLVRDMYTEGQMQRHGLKVYTNLDPLAQEAAERALDYGIKHAPAGCTQGALVSINVRDGAVVALVGGVGDYMKNQWNCATNPHTAGSAFKPFVYLAGLDRGMIAPSSMIEDEPVIISMGQHEADYKPKNFDGKYLGTITVAEALAYSRNTCAVRMAERVGIATVADTARRAGIRTKLDPQIALALGCSAVSPLDMASAYSTLARGGVYIKPSVLRRIDDKNGRMLQTFYHASEHVFESQPVAQLVDMLQEVVAQGTGTQARLGDRPVAGKTGTSDQAKDLWFVGFTPDLSTAVWGGSSDNRAIAGSHTTGGTVMARIWREYNRAYYAKHDVPVSWFAACTHLAGNIKFPAREAKIEKPDDKPNKHVAPRTVHYNEIDPSTREEQVRHVAAPVHSNTGIVEYHWSR